MDIKNLIGLEKPLVKLVETMSEGVGVMGNHLFSFDAKKIKRIGAAEAKKEKLKIIEIAKAGIEVEKMQVLGRAKIRFEMEQYNKQRNIENTFVLARDLLKGKDVSDDPVDKDWTQRFIGVAEEVSREDIQSILAKILAGEVEKPNSYSLRTLEILKNLSKNDLEIFVRIASLYSEDKIIIPNGKGRGDGGLQKYGIEYIDLLHCVELGLLGSNIASLSWPLELNSEAIIQEVKEINFHINRIGVFVLKQGVKIRIPVIRLTKPGLEIASLIAKNDENFKKYKKDLIKFLVSKNLPLFSEKIIKTPNLTPSKP